mgnify:CR=1 FL=1
MANNLPRRAAVLGGNRIPFARQFGAYAEASNQDMFTAALDGLVARYNLGGKHIDEVAEGGELIEQIEDRHGRLGGIAGHVGEALRHEEA